MAKGNRREARETSPLSEELRAIFGNDCKAARTKKGLSQQEVASATGIPQPRIAQIELGKVNVTLETIMRIARVIDLDLPRLLREPDALAE